MRENADSFFIYHVADYEAHVAGMVADGALDRALADALGLKGASRLLCLFCGAGGALDEIMKRTPWISVTGADPSPGLLARLLAKPYAARLTFVHSPGPEMNLGAGAFDAAISAMSTRLFPEEGRRALYLSAFGALRPGGRYAEGGRASPEDARATQALLRAAGFSSVQIHWQNHGKALFVAGKD
jgi:ubiquinone/menaquinone biosynthesis C-methylase UbiE